MRIMELRFKNLNSLYGEWCIDFNTPEYTSNGIFALTGPTGAGKSTVLDAICLALYGATPRLGKITKSGNEVMSRQSGECYAEVLFESQVGRFRCHWEQHRARKKADGALQDQEHQITDADTGKPIETKKSLVTGVIEEKTGMDFGRFTRSILLAQGSFDAFLKAGIEEKSKILEQITGTGIYSTISCRVHERQREENEKLKLLQSKISNIALLEPGEEERIQQNLQTNKEKENQLNHQSEQIKKAINWLNTIDLLKKDINEIFEEKAELQRHIEAFKPERNKLVQGQRADSLAGPYASLIALRKQQADDEEGLRFRETSLPKLEKSADTQAGLLRVTEQRTVRAREELKTVAPLIQEIRSLDQELAKEKKAVSEGIEACTEDEKKINANKRALAEEQKTHTQAKENLRLAADYLKEHAQDEWLIGNLAGVEEQFSNLHFRQNEIAREENSLKSAHKALEQAEKDFVETARQCDSHRRELKTTEENLQQAKEDLSQLLDGRLLREYRDEKEALLRETSLLKRIEELEDQRARLEDGKPCPLCGATEHPFAKGNAPMSNEIELKIESLSRHIGLAESQEEIIKKMERTESTTRGNLARSEKMETSADGDKKAAEKALARVEDGLGELRTELGKRLRAVLDNLKLLGVDGGFSGESPEIRSLLESLKLRRNTWQEQKEKGTEIERQIDRINTETVHLNAIIKTQGDELDKKRKQLEARQKGYETVTEKHRELHTRLAGPDERDERGWLNAANSKEPERLPADKANPSPDDEERRLNKAITDAEEAEREARNRNTELQQELTAARTDIGSLKKRIEERTPELQKAEGHLASGLASEGFADEQQFLKAKLTKEELDGLSARAQELDDAQTDLNARQNDRKTRLAKEIARKITDKTLDELETGFNDCKESLGKLHEAQAHFKNRLEENAIAQKKIEEEQSAIKAQERECRRWAHLNVLIGSADGKKYRNFAQGLTFELMVRHANFQLEKMTDRYLLIRDAEQPLELNVVDDYQAGETRSTRNLSGGEGFIVSLALALGLSRMASRKVRVDSLFLDEGFGTLDEEALETALETLAGLQQDGKLIGVISHVTALKERIGTQISVAPLSGGHSSLAGPGCRRLRGVSEA